MALEIAVTVFLINGIIYADGLHCESCRGSACSEANVPIIDCDEQAYQLPYNFEISQSNIADTVHTCIELEFAKGQRKVPVRQCLLVSTSNNLCREISVALPSSVKLEKCNVARYKRKADEDIPITSGESTTVPADTSSADITTVSAADPASEDSAISAVASSAVITSLSDLASAAPSIISTVISTAAPASSAVSESTIPPAALLSQMQITSTTSKLTDHVNEIVKTVEEKLSTIHSNDIVNIKVQATTQNPHIITGKALTTIKPKGGCAVSLISMFALSLSLLIQTLL